MSKKKKKYQVTVRKIYQTVVDVEADELYEAVDIGSQRAINEGKWKLFNAEAQAVLEDTDGRIVEESDWDDVFLSESEE